MLLHDFIRLKYIEFEESPISVVSQNMQKPLLSELERNSRTLRPERQQILIPWSHFQVYNWTILNILSHSTPFPLFPSALGVFHSDSICLLTFYAT